MIENIASACIGFVIGYLLMYFLPRLTTFSPKVLRSLISVILGGTVAGFLGKLSNNIPVVLSLYLIGLFVGFVVAFFLYWYRYKVPPILQTFCQKIGLLTKRTP
jgi:putative flippase GtrA